MAPYLDTVKSFTDVPVTEKGVDTVSFLEASEGLVGMFDLLGSAAFSVVQNDLRGNITKVQNRYNAAPTVSTTLEELVKNEQGEKKRTATEGLMWLLRGLGFTCLALKSSHSNPSEELSNSFTKSYESTLKKHHSFVVRPIFAVAMKACPYRQTFYEKLSDGAPQNAVNEKMGTWVNALDAIVKRMNEFYEKGGYGKGF